MPVELVLLTRELLVPRVLEETCAALLPEGMLVSYRREQLHQLIDAQRRTVMTVFECKAIEDTPEVRALLADPVTDPTLLRGWSEVILPDSSRPGEHDTGLRLLSGVVSLTQGVVQVRA